VERRERETEMGEEAVTCSISLSSPLHSRPSLSLKNTNGGGGILRSRERRPWW